MARSLEGKQFYICYNNGVNAVVSGDILEDIQKKRAVASVLRATDDDVDFTPHIPEFPIFTFANEERVSRSPWFTGIFETDLKPLLGHIANNGGRIYGDSSFHVPFSNGCEVSSHGREAQLEELRYVTTSAQFEETFGISLHELRNPKGK